MPQHNTSTGLFSGRSVPRHAFDTQAAAYPNVHVLRGRAAALDAQPLLAQLARNSGQTGEADSLGYLLTTPNTVEKTPYVLTIGSRGGHHAEPTGAVSLFEYRSAGLSTRVFFTADWAGRRSVLAPPMLRAQTAAIAARALIQRGAHFVQILFSETHHSEEELRSREGHLTHHAAVPPDGFAEQTIADEFRIPPSSRIQCQWALREREIPAYLQLLPTFDATLARIGQRTRSNLRYYRRRAEIDLGAHFVATPTISLDEFLVFNRECTYAVPEPIAIHRYRTLSAFPNIAFRGVRDRHRRWLSLVGVRHQGTFVEIDWQMNRDDLPSRSLGIVMRSYLIDHEIACGRTRLYIEGGTPQPIARSFLTHRVAELSVKRESAYIRTLTRLVPWVFPAKNYIGQTLVHPDLHWKSW